MPTQEVIEAQVSKRILSKVDRLFTNRLDHIFVELLQNARRANATAVHVDTEQSSTGAEITFWDNGDGIEDFSKLLHLGDSDWDAETEAKEDPAGMGFFSLAHSGVEVTSQGKRANISKKAFLGQECVEIDDVADFRAGTQLKFFRTQDVGTIRGDLERVVKFGPIDVWFDGELLEREDFLKHARYIKELPGYRIGVFDDTSFKTRFNFYGSVIEIWDTKSFEIDRVFRELDCRCGVKAIHVAVDIADTSQIRLTLPDRTKIVEGAAYEDLVKQARIVMFEYIGTKPEHLLDYSLYEEARSLGIELQEAAPYLRDYSSQARNSSGDESPFGEVDTSTRVMDLSSIALVDGLDFDFFDDDGGLGFTFEAAFRLFHELNLVPVAQRREFAGYSWYDRLPRYTEFGLNINGEGFVPGFFQDSLTIVDSIELNFKLVRGDGEEVESISWQIPIAGFADADYNQGCSLFVTSESPWVQQKNVRAEPLDLIEVAQYVGFDPGQDFYSDSYETQKDYFQDHIVRTFTEVLNGATGLAEHELRRVAFDHELTYALDQAGITSVRLYNTNKGWKFEIGQPA